MAEPVLLPVEIWCQIFLYMDGATTRNASAVCRLFFGILRGDEKYSGHVILKQINLSQLVMKIKSKEWTWERWPCLKILEIPIQLGYPDYTCAIGEELIGSIKLLNLEQCLSLDKILIFNCAFPLFHGNTFIVRTVCFNPRTIPKTISLEDVAHLEIFRLEDTIAYCLRTIGRLAKKVNSLSIRLESQFYPHQLFLTNEFTLINSYKVNQKPSDQTQIKKNLPYSLRRHNISKHINDLLMLFYIPKKGDFCRIAGKYVKVYKKYGFFIEFLLLNRFFIICINYIC